MGKNIQNTCLINNTDYQNPIQKTLYKCLKSIFGLLLVVLIASLNSLDALAQCACAGTDFGTINVAGWTVGQSANITTCQYGGERATIQNTVAGAVYRISTCGAGYDTQLSIYTTGCTFIAYNDDNGPACGGTAASVQFTSPGGNLYSKMNQYNCVTNSTCTTVSITLISCPSPTLGSVSNAGPINFCDASGNFGTPATVSGQNGAVVWDWGSNNGVWNLNWVASNSSGVCCFPKKTSNSDGNADRIRYRVTNCGTSVTSGTILIVNRYNEAPSNLVASSSSYACNAIPGTITLTANFPASINKNGLVAFYSGSCGGTLLGTVTAGDNTSAAALTITAPSTTTNYFVRYEPGTGTNCSNTACASTTVTVSPISNDACSSAINIGTSLPYTSAVINNSCATDDFTTSSCDGPYKNVWWTVTGPSCVTTLTAITCTGGTNFDNEMAVFTGSCGSFTQVTCNDDNGAGCTSNYAGVSWASTPGTVYYISVGSYFSGGTTGNLQLNVTGAADVTPPSLDAITINSNCWIADDRHTYTITCQTSDPSGIGGSTYGTMALVNYQGSNAGNYGGYFAWNTSLALLNAAGYTLDQCEAAGGGFVGKANSFGQSTITLVSGSTSVSGNQRTVNFVVRPNNTFPVSTVNAISLYSGDACNNQAGWANFQLNFSSQTTQTITCPANITSCGSQVVSYSTPTATCNTTVVRNAGLASGSTFPLGVNTVTYNTYYPNGAGGYFNYAPGATNQQIALAACESVYGVGNCNTGSCGNFTYYKATAHLSCDCNKPVGQYEFIYSNTGYTQVGQDYGGNTTNVSGNSLFTRVKTAAGCTSNSWTLAQPALGQGGASCSFNVNVSVMSASVGVTNVTCNGGSNGVVSANVTGGISPYTYSWSPGGQTTAVVTGRAPGTYTVTITDAVGCTTAVSGTVSQPAAIGLSTAVTNTSCPAVCDGAINLTVTGGTPSATQPNATGLATNLVLWANGDNGILRDASSGTLQWSDLSGAVNNITQAAAANRPTWVSGAINGRPVLRFNTSQFMTSAANFGTPYTIFTISKMNNGTDYRLISSANTNWLMGNWGGNQDVMYANGWVTAASGPTPDNLTHMYAATGTGALTTFYDFSTTIASNAGGVSGPGQLQLNSWSNGLTEASDGDVAEVIVYNRVLTATELQGVRNYLAAKYAIAGSGGSAYTYNWSNGATTEDIASLCAGTYTVTVTDANGCVAVNTSVVGTNGTLSVAPTSITGTTTICNGGSTTLTVNGGTVGTGAVTQWFTGSCGGTSAGTGNSITVSPTTTTTYFVRYAGTCNTTTCASVTVTVAQLPTTASAGPDQNVCATSVTLAANTPSIGTGSWSIISGAGGSVTTPTSPTSTFTGVAGTTYTLRWTISNAPCTASTDDVIIILTANPTTANAGPDQNVCATSVTLAANTPSIGTGSWSIISGAGGAVTTPTSPTSTFTGVAGTSYTLRWTISNAPCTASTDDVIIILTANPTTANAGPDQNVCATSVTLAGNTATIGTGSWSIISGAGGSVTTPTSPTSTFTGVAGTTYTLRWTISNAPCAASTDDVVITLTANPTTANAGPDQNVCATSVTLAANTPSIGTGSWSIISGAGGSVTTPTSPTSTFTGVAGTTYTLRWTISNAPCTASTDDVIIILTANPTTANAGPDQNVCATSVTLAANTPSIGTGSWSIISGAGGAVTTPTSPTSTFTGVAGTSYTLRWTISNAPCTASTDDVIIILTANPTTANAGPDQNVCATSVTLAGNTATIGTGSWSIISGAGGAVTTPTSPTSTFTGVAGTTYTLRWTISNAPCTASTDDVIITLTANPTTANAGPDQNVCATSVTLAGNTATIGTGSWSIISGAGGAVTTPTSPTSTFTGVAGTTYTLRWTISNAPCTASTDDVIITLTANPTTANAGPDQNVCATSVTLAANTATIGTGAWSIISGAGGSVTTPTSPTSTFTGVAGTTYTLRWTISNAPCAASTDDVIITLTANPTTANAGPDQNVCATSVTLAANTPSIGTGSWSIISGAGGSVTTPTSPTSTFTGVAGTTYTLRWTISNAPCTASTDDVVITINTQSVAPTGATGTTTICDGGSTTLTVAGGSLGTGAVVEWFTGSCGGTSAGTGNSITVSPTTTTTYYVRYAGTCNTTTCATVTVTVNTLSVAASSVSGASTICNGGSATLTLSGGSLGTGATWQWYSGSCGGTPVGSGTSITVTPSATTTYFVRAEGTCNTTTCPSGATVTVVSSPSITSQPNSPAPICAGATSSNITVVATGGTPSLTYQWEYNNGGTWGAVSNGTPTGASYSGGTSPSMAVTLANASNPSSSHQYRCVIAAAGSGCASVTSDVVTVTVYALPQITSSTSSLCEGATRTLQSDIAVVTWTASGCPTCITGGNIFTAPDPGGASANYTITASNNGCYGPASSYVQTVYDAVNADAGTNQTQCNNGTFTLAGNTPPAYPGIVAGWTLISGTATITTPSSPTSTVTGVPEGSSATLQWTIFNGSCTSSSTVILANNRAATANAGSNQAVCSGETITLSGSIGGSATSSTWTASSGTFSNASSLTSTYTPSITNGTVTLTLTTDDPDGTGPCSVAIATVVITVNERPSVTTSVVSVGCFGGSNGSATANATGGTPSYTYSWSTSPTQSTQTATNLLPGTYTVTVTDQNGCSTTAAAVVSEPSMPLNAVATFANETCNELNNGSIDVSVSGGTSPYTYIWSNGANTQDLNPLSAGTYVVTITDNNGCVTVLSQTVTQPSLLAATITPTNETCNELNNGTATVNVTGGSVPIAYLWSTSATTVSISSLSAGSYSVTVTDTNGCTASATTLITQPDVLTINAPIVTNESCSAANNGSIAASVNGGTAAYTYTWSSGGGNVPTISGLDAGTYSLTVTDINSCATTVLGIVVGSNPTPSITVANSTSICAGGVANLVASVTNPDAANCGIQWQSSPDGSSWSNISGATGITYTSSALSTTTYYQAIYDCSTPCDATSNTAVITVNAVPSISVSGGTSVCVGGDATLTATPAGGANGCSIQWESSPNGTTWTPIPGANASTYTTPVLSVTTYYHATYTCGGDGCATATSASATVTVNGLPSIVIGQ